MSLSCNAPRMNVGRKYDDRKSKVKNTIRVYNRHQCCAMFSWRLRVGSRLMSSRQATATFLGTLFRLDYNTINLDNPVE
uniref:Uncharacterized protein n=1 Tax=Strigamia maritima TaxID=126957 RepID=T1JHF8_STRMM